jgi:hypothetical protein
MRPVPHASEASKFAKLTTYILASAGMIVARTIPSMSLAFFSPKGVTSTPLAIVFSK